MSAPAREPGATWGRYELVAPIAQGGMAAVFEGRHVDLRKRVAVKIMHPQHASDAALVQRFIEEARAASRLQHPHVIAVHDVGVAGDVPYMVMDRLEGEELYEVLLREGRLEVERLADLMLGVVSAVAAAHADELLHRDLKPENVFVTRTRGGAEHAMLLDFGISKPLGGAGQRSLTTFGMLVGTPEYMAPEQLDPAVALDPRCDQYALGVILYECATGQSPFRGDSLPQLFASIVAGKAPRPSELVPSLPPAFEALVLRAMSPDRADRFASVRELGRALWPFASARARAVWAEEFGSPTVRRASARPSAPPPSSADAACVEVTLRPAELRVFSAFEEADDDELGTVLTCARALRYAEGARIVEEGAQGGGCFMLVDGEVEVARSSGGVLRVLGRLPKGAVFGEIAVVDHLPRAASVIAASAATILYLDREGFDRLVADHGELALRLREHVVISGIRQLRRATRRLSELLERGVEGDAVSRQELEYVQAASREWALPLPDGGSARG